MRTSLFPKFSFVFIKEQFIENPMFILLCPISTYSKMISCPYRFLRMNKMKVDVLSFLKK